jgi:hypothetical protein
MGILHGYVEPACVEAVLRLVPKQFQVAMPPYSRRGEIWDLSSPVRGFKRACIVLNDRAVATAAMTQVLVLPYADGVLSSPLLMVGKSTLEKRLGQLKDGQQSQLDSILRDIFGI